MKYLLFALLVLFLICPVNLKAQKVGVVLSGGGAKGYAHVGLLKALEENHIPIDYICGTSIGAIVGGLYAIGYTPAEMEELLGSEQFYKWSQGKIDIHEKYYYKLKNEQPDWLEFDFKKEGDVIKPQLPTNVIGPEQMDLRFLQFYSPGAAKARYNFDSLFVPFFCVATDVHRNESVICRSGDLPSSIRASMTFPGYFKPITMNGVLLFDGGMENNFPADLMKEFYNPDIIIGCKVANNPAKPNADDLYLQLENVFMKAANFNIPGAGILIEPDVSTFGIMDFDKFDIIEQKGYDRTIEKIDSIKMLVSRIQDSVELAVKRQKFIAAEPPLIFDNIYVNGADHESTSYILKNIRRNRRTLTFKEFEQEYFKLLSDKLVRSIYPRAIFNWETGYYDIDLDISVKNSLTLKLGGNLSSSYRSMGLIGVDYVFQKKNIYNLGGNIILGQFYNSLYGHFRIDFPPRMVKKDKVLSPFFANLSIGLNRWDFFKTSGELFIDSDELSQVIETDNHVAADFGMPVRNRGILSGGFSYGMLDYRYFQTAMVGKNDIADRTVLNYSSLHGTFEYNTLNFKQYASEGAYFKTQIRYITGLEEYSPGTSVSNLANERAQKGHSWINLTAVRERYFKLSHHVNLGYRGSLNLSDKSVFLNSISSLLSSSVYAPFPQSKTLVLEKFRANNWVGFGVIPMLMFSDEMQVRAEFHIFQPYKYIYTRSFETTYSKPFPTPRYMGNLSVVYQTPIGPLAVTGSFFYKEEIPFYFQVNLGYVLFNKKGLE